ncbi:hypothetical protein PC116_g33261 [Phytophthora cactorum]|nr:hypothetical protein PC116_g33261 [Phytophthora cactorum]
MLVPANANAGFAAVVFLLFPTAHILEAMRVKMVCYDVNIVLDSPNRSSTLKAWIET